MNERRIMRPAVVPGEKPTAEKILDAAIDRFAENGFESTSVKSIALSLGLTAKRGVPEFHREAC